MPLEAQVAPINDIQLLDFNKDGNKDLLLIGNNFGNETFIGQYDAFNGLVLQGDGEGNFSPISAKESGFLVRGDAKNLVNLKTKYHNLFIVAQNRGKLLVFKELN